MKRFLVLVLLPYIALASKQNHHQIKYQAWLHLQNLECQQAKDVLESISNRYLDPDYVLLRSKVYECFNSFLLSEIDLKELDIYNFLPSMSQIYVKETSMNADDFIYENVFESIQVLMGNTKRALLMSTMDRIKHFGAYKARIMNEKLLNFNFLQFRNELVLYGNTDLNGVKGAGNNSNSCFFSYKTQDAVEFVNDFGGSGSLGSCTTATGKEGSLFLDVKYEGLLKVKRRMCKLITSLNSIMDLVKNMGPLSHDKWYDIKDLPTVFNTMLVQAEMVEATAGGGRYNDGEVSGQNAISRLRHVFHQKQCEGESIPALEKYFAIFMETFLQ